MMSKNKKTKTKRALLRHDSAEQARSSNCSGASRVEITRIHSYERNPRRSQNPEYDRIKASILKSGMDQALSITKRPGEKDYIVQAGGNTRLQIV